MERPAPYGARATSSKKMKLLPWLVWGIAALFYCYENFLQVSLNVIGPDVIKAFQLSAAQLGILVSFYFYAYAAMQIPVGILIDRYGPRIVLTLASLCIGFGCLFFGTAHVVSFAEFGRLLIGFGSAFAIVSCFKLASNWFPLERFAFLCGLTITIGFSGSIFGQYPLALLVDAFGWRSNMISYSVLGFLLTVLLFYIVRNVPAHSDANVLPDQKLEKFSVRQGLAQIMVSKQNWLTAIYGSLMFTPTIVLGTSWGGVFMMSAHKLDRPTAAATISAVYFGWIIGAPLFGFISDKMRKRKPVLWAASVGTLCSIVPVIYLSQLHPYLIAALFFSFGLFSSGFLPSFSIIRESNPSRVTGTALGFMNTMNSLGGVFAPYLIGLLLDWHWSGLMENGTRSYTVGDFHVAFAILPIMVAISLAILLFIKETHCRTSAEMTINK